MRNYLLAIIRKILGVDNLTLYKKKKLRTFQKLIYRKKYTADDIVCKMQELGIKRGSIVFVHSSMTQFYNYQGTVEELIFKIIEIIGSDGTLLMPAYPKEPYKLIEEAKNDSNKIIFDVNSTPTGAGYMTEVFRKIPGVKRSINVQHSVCAIGKDADFFLSEHHLSNTAWDEKSPYYKLCKSKAMIFKFGLPNFIETPLHCTESLLCNKYQYFSLFFQGVVSYKYIDHNNNIGVHTMKHCTIQRKPNNRRIRRNYIEPQQIIKATKLSNLLIEMSYASDILDSFLDLAENGITIFDAPDPKPYIKNGKFIECS